MTFNQFCNTTARTIGTQGVAVSFVARGEEDRLFKKIEETIGTTIEALPGRIAFTDKGQIYHEKF